MRIEIPELSVVALIGVSGSGKSTFAKKYFKETEILSSDYFRGLISDDENDQSISSEAFESLYFMAKKRLDNKKLVVIDATNVQKRSRDEVLKLAREQNCLPVAIVLDMPENLCLERNLAKEDRKHFSPNVVKNQGKELRRSLKYLEKEGFRKVYIIKSLDEIENIEIIRTKLLNDKKDENGPFDIIGDVHGCFEELCELLEKLGYKVDKKNYDVIAPIGRKVIFLGDLCDRGAQNMDVLKLVMSIYKNSQGYCLLGNHDTKLLKKLKGSKISLNHGINLTLGQLEEESEEFVQEVKIFLESLISHYVLDDGKLVVAHAGLIEKYQGRSSRRVREFSLYGENSGENDEYGLPIRINWAEKYRGRARVVYGHVASIDVEIQNNTFCIDTGCVYGGALSAYCYPENEIVQVKAKKVYFESQKPLEKDIRKSGDILDIKDVLGKKTIKTRFDNSVIINENNAIPALEIISRFAADPHWLIYLPPTMSPCETSTLDKYLEYPTEAFNYYKSHGVEKVVCEEKHMGSRAVIVLCKDENTVEKRFGIKDGTIGLIYTRTGRHFFDDRKIEQTILKKLLEELNESNFWEDYNTDWICLDTELMPWSAKAQQLLKDQYAPVGRAGKDGLKIAVELLEETSKRPLNGFSVDDKTSGQNFDINETLSKYKGKYQNLVDYTNIYGEYCWEIENIEDYKIAPFHILATENKVWNDVDHITHMEIIKKYIARKNNLFVSTNYIIVDLKDEISIEEGITWWENLTKNGGEGMVVKPHMFLTRHKGAIIQPAVKCRGREYLRIIYGPEYTSTENLIRLKKRALSKKRSMAHKEFIMGMESLERFILKEPLYRVHECVFGILAMESEPVDPRL